MTNLDCGLAIVEIVHRSSYKCFLRYKFQSNREFPPKQHGQQELSNMLVADVTSIRVQRYAHVRTSPATPRGFRTNNDRSVPLSLLRRRRGRHGVSYPDELTPRMFCNGIRTHTTIASRNPGEGSK